MGRIDGIIVCRNETGYGRVLMKKIKRMIAGCILAAAVIGFTACAVKEEQEAVVASESVSDTAQAAPSAEEQNLTEDVREGIRIADLGEGTAAGPAANVVNDIVFGWNLGNTLDSYSGTQLGHNEGLASETAWGNPKATQELIDLVKDNGINAVRVPVTWYNHMDSDYVIDQEWMNRVQEVVDYVIHNDMYCIINVHHDTGAKGWLKASDANLEEKETMYTAIWEQISVRFADYDGKLMFEGFNELLNDSDEWVNPDNRALEITNELNQIFVDTVRSSGGNNADRVLIVNTYCAGGNSQVTRDFVLPADSAVNSLIVEAHIYQPYYFTAEESPDVTTWSRDGLDSYLDNMYTGFIQKGIPVIIGEFGCVDKGNATERLSWAKYYMETCKEYGIKCFWWDNGTAYKVFSRRSLKVAEPELLGTMLAAAKGEEYVPQAEEAEEVTDNLCANVDNWSGWANTGTQAVISYLPDGVSVEVIESGEEEWYIQGSYINLTLEQGASYELSFDYVATLDITIPYHFQQNYEPYGVYVSGEMDCTKELQHYTTTINMTQATDGNVALVFNCGKREESVPYTLTVTNLSLVKL